MFDEWCVECEQLGITAYNGFYHHDKELGTSNICLF